MQLTFREKGLWLLLLSLVFGFGTYFAAVLPERSDNIAPADVKQFIGMVILLTVIQVVGQVIVSIASRGELAASVQSDERDFLINLRSTCLGRGVLAAGVFSSLCVAVFVNGNFAFVHVLLGFWVLAQAVEIVSQLILYRRGV